jgi:hypothetical protein
MLLFLTFLNNVILTFFNLFIFQNLQINIFNIS